MSKAPSGNVQEYQGDGDWFKIWEKTICYQNGDLTKDAWCTWGMGQLEFQIPEDTPAGEYLIRAEHIGLHGAQANEAEFFYRYIAQHLSTRHIEAHTLCSCAQVKVTGSESGSPSTTYKIPGIYNDNMKLFNGLNLWVNSADEIESDILDTPIGDNVWRGTGSSSSSASSTTSIYASATPEPTQLFTCGRRF